MQIKRLIFTLLPLTMGFAVRAEADDRAQALQVWKITHSSSGSVATGLKHASITAEFPHGPILSGKNIDLPPKIITGNDGTKSWAQWTIPAFIKIKETQTYPANQKKKVYFFRWRLLAKLRDGRVVEARRDQGGTDSAFTNGVTSTRCDAMQFRLTTNVATRRDYRKIIQNLENNVTITAEELPDKPVLWRDVVELWFLR